MPAVEYINLGFLVLAVFLLILLFFKRNKTENEIELEKLKSEIKNSLETTNALLKQMAEINQNTIKNYNESVLNSINHNNLLQKEQLKDVEGRLQQILQSTKESLKEATLVLEKGLDKMQINNDKKLEEMRVTVDEKLNVSLEKRLGESFNIINNRLQSVYEGLGEMRTLATGVGDLKKVLTNIKTRGVWGEVQLGNLLEQMLSPDQYASQVEIKNGERVDFVVKLPGKDNKNIYLPIDAKFPLEDYQRLCDANDSGNLVEVEACLKALEKRVKDEAKKIKEKYINLPDTTDFAVMYLAIEGLYAEVLRRSGLAETLQQQYKIVVCGPTTLSALLSSLQLGFKTLSIEKRSSEIWQLLGTFKQEFGKFVKLLAKTQKKLSEASNTIEDATKKSKTIQRKLKNVADITDSNENTFIEENTEDNDD